MDWTEEVKGKLKRKNMVLFSKDSQCLLELNDMLSRENHITITLWALELAEETVNLLREKYPEEDRPEKALEAARRWASGEIFMREAQRKILDCHGLAKELDSLEDIALCHAVGQGCSVVHTAGHAMGYPIYELTAIVRKWGLENSVEKVENRISYYIDRLIFWSQKSDSVNIKWAKFMLK